MGGLPAGAVLVAVAIGLMLAGVWLLRRAESDLATLLVFLLFTIPATAVILVGPAVILVVVNLGS